MRPIPSRNSARWQSAGGVEISADDQIAIEHGQ
jgi:hypothetical protein